MAVWGFGILKKQKFHLFYTCFKYAIASPTGMYDYVDLWWSIFKIYTHKTYRGLCLKKTMIMKLGYKKQSNSQRNIR